MLLSETATNLTDVPDDILMQVFLADILMIKLWRLVCRRLHFVSEIRAIWIEALSQFGAEHPLLKPRLEVAIASYETRELERIALRVKRLRLNWDNKNPRIIRNRTLYRTAISSALGGEEPAIIFIPGGRWVLAQPEVYSSKIVAWDLDHHGVQGKILIPNNTRVPDAAIALHHTLNLTAKTLEFELGVERRSYSMHAPQMSQISFWRVKLVGDNYRNSRLQACCISSLDLGPVDRNFFLSGDIAICAQQGMNAWSGGEVAQQIDLYRWKELVQDKRCPVASLLIVGFRRIIHAQITPAGSIIIVSSDRIELYDIPAYKRVPLKIAPRPADGIARVAPKWTKRIGTREEVQYVLHSLTPSEPLPSIPAMTIFLSTKILLLTFPPDHRDPFPVEVGLSAGAEDLIRPYMGHSRGAMVIYDNQRNWFHRLSYSRDKPGPNNSLPQQQPAEDLNEACKSWKLQGKSPLNPPPGVRSVLAFDEWSGRVIVENTQGERLVLDFA